jgi:hypothetical protein
MEVKLLASDLAMASVFGEAVDELEAAAATN